MLKRISAFLASCVLSLSSLFVFAPVMVRAVVDECEWVGGGAADNFDDAANWSCSLDGTALPTDGDSLLFDLTDLTANLTINHDLVALTSVADITLTGTSSQGYTYKLEGNDLTLTGDIVSTTYGLSIYNNLTLGANSDFGSVFIEGDVALGANTLTLSGETSIYGVISGTGNVVSDSLYTSIGGENTYTGTTTVNTGASLFACALGTSAGATTVADGGSLTLNVADEGTSDEPITLNGTGTDGEGALWVVVGCGSGGFGGGGGKLVLPEGDSQTLSEVTLASDTTIYVYYKDTLTLEGATLGGFEATLAEDSHGTLVVNGESSTYDPEDVTVDEDTDDTEYHAVYSGETLTVNGKTGFVELFDGATLKGSGEITGLLAYPDSTVAPGNSPGCLSTGGINLSESTLVVEIAGAEACDGYDQMQVTGLVELYDAVLDLSFTNEDYLPAAGTTFTVIDNDEDDDAVTGTFANLPEGETFEENGGVFSVSYEGGDGNDVVVTVVTAPTAPDTGANFGLQNPGVTLFATTMLAGAMVLISKRYAKSVK